MFWLSVLVAYVFVLFWTPRSSLGFGVKVFLWGPGALAIPLVSVTSKLWRIAVVSSSLVGLAYYMLLVAFIRSSVTGGRMRMAGIAAGVALLVNSLITWWVIVSL